MLFVWQNDGTKPWKDPEELTHITFEKKTGLKLKGTEAGQSKAIGNLMYQYQAKVRKAGFETFGFLNGHCDRCKGRKCPQRDNPPCKKHGMPSLEAIGIDVYKLMEAYGIEYEYPCVSYITAITMMLVK